MEKFESVETLMYKSLLANTEEEIRYSRDRIIVLDELGDTESLDSEKNFLATLEAKKEQLTNFLEASLTGSSSHPSRIVIASINKFGEEYGSVELSSEPLNDKAKDYYLEKTNFQLKDYKLIPEGEIFRCGNMLIQKNGEDVISKYPKETMWYPLDDDFPSDADFLKQNGHLYLYKEKNSHPLAQ